MRNQVVYAALVLMLCLNAAPGQTVSEVEKKYGKPVNAYHVSEHIWMAPEYAADGQMCRATFYHNRISPLVVLAPLPKDQPIPLEFPGTDYPGAMPKGELLGVFNELAPLGARGAKKEYFGVTETSSGTAWTTFPYEKVTLTFWIGFKPGSIADMEAKGVPFGGRSPSKIVGTDDEFIAANAVNPEVANIRWNDRKCVGE